MTALPGTVVLDWGDRKHAFRVGPGEWREIQKTCDAGPGIVVQRLFLVASLIEKGLSVREIIAGGGMGEWRIDDVRAVILHGLIGAGMGPIEAAEHVRRNVDTRLDFRANLALAYAIGVAGLEGLEGAPPPGEPEGEGGSPSSPTERSTSTPSTETPPPADSPPAT